MQLSDDFTLHLTGHVFVDVGIFVCMAHANKKRVEDVTWDDLHNLAQYLKELYCDYDAMTLFLNNNSFFNTQFRTSKKREDRYEYADEVLMSFRHDTVAQDDDEACVFFPELKSQIVAHRQYIPLLNGNDVKNFYPKGRGGLPISGLASLLIHAMPLGCYKMKSRLLTFQQYDANGQSGFARILVQGVYNHNMIAITMMQKSGLDKLPDYGQYAKTRYIEALISTKNKAESRSIPLGNLTGYYFSNFGKDPMIQVLRLNNMVAKFVDVAQQDFHHSWNLITQKSWVQLKKGKNDNSDVDYATLKNSLYEGLFDLPYNAYRFLKLLFIGRNWELLTLFLERIMQMEQERIEVYRELGDRLAEYALRYENKPLSFYHEFSRNDKYDALRRILRRAFIKMLREKETNPLFTYDEFILAFEHPSDTYNQWKLGRDLIGFRMLERFHQFGLDTSTLDEDDSELEQSDNLEEVEEE